MRVLATRQGFYNQHLCEPGEVFDLLDNPDGSMPIRMLREYELDKHGKPTGEYTETPYLDKEGNVMHRDFAPDMEELPGKGLFRGESYAPGWMVQVPDETECGIYEPDVRFREDGTPDTKRPIQRIIKAANEPTNLPHITPMRGKVDRTRRARPP